MHVRKCTHYVTCVLLYTFNVSCAGVHMYDVSLLHVCMYTHKIFMHIYLYIYIRMCILHHVLLCAGVYMIYLGVCTCNLGVCMCNVCIVVSFPNQSSFTLSLTHPHSRPFSLAPPLRDAEIHTTKKKTEEIKLINKDAMPQYEIA